MADFCDKLKSGVLWIVRWDNRVGTKIIFIVMCSLFLISWFSGIFRVLGNNLGLNQWDYIACVIALCSMCMAILTFISQQNTERNTMKITPKGQMGLLMDYVRHFYTNMVITLAIEHKMDGKYKKAYPSQEHLLKLKADLEALHPEAFVQNEEQYKQIHNLLILIRNYNTEVDVAIMHLTDKSIDKDVKKRSFDTLRLKPGLISDRIMECIGNIWGRYGHENEASIGVNVGRR